MKPVLFASVRTLERAENIHAVYEAFDGPKEFVQVDGKRHHPAISSRRFDVLVIDEFPTESPGRCVMMWHAIQGGKKIGIDQPNPYYTGKKASLMDYIVTSGKGVVDMFAGCSTLPRDRVLPLGMPRTDGYQFKRKGDGKTELAGKRAYLFAPTFRSRNEPQIPFLDWEWLDDELTDNELLVVKTHMLTGTILNGRFRHIIEVNSNLPSAPYLIDCDVVVTDYSSILFDGYLLGKPAVLLETEKGYTETRGMYLQYPEQYCSRYCTNEAELLKQLRNADGLNGTEKECLRLVADACDGHATERVCKLIRQLNKSN